MRRLLIVLSVLLLLPLSASAWMSPLVCSGGGQSSSLSCQAYVSTYGTVSSYDVCRTSSSYYAGQAQWSPASGTVSICKVSFTLTRGDGSVIGYTYYAKIWSMDGTSLDTVLGKSSGVKGSNEWSDTDVTFTFSSPVSCAAGTDYAITLDHGETEDGASYIRINRNGADTLNGYIASWGTAKTIISSTADREASFAISTMQ